MSDNVVDAPVSQIVIETAESSSAIVLQPEYATPQEAIGAMSIALIKSGKCITFNEIQLMLIVRLKLASEQSQKDILREALMLITNKSLY
ncbi:biofilm development regulator YmgB/AriR family protein [Mixta gaviniae]|uniref:Two-component-system connector protein AriR n=1 Tax=Mixta gaviniae TaxID=665914 RepID=A0A2L0IGB6_9GAMM|nr:biofilm development regulator YmgB/AriR family protein [Mixta gaviniae]AUX93549.1 hypothetical protein C2E15_10990 [Mixta gaviniae]